MDNVINYMEIWVKEYMEILMKKNRWMQMRYM